MIGDDRAKDEALLEVYTAYDYRHDTALAPWTQLTAAELTRFCRWFAALDATASLLDKAEAVLTIVTFITSLHRLFFFSFLTSHHIASPPLISRRTHTALGRVVSGTLTPDDLVDGLTYLVMRLKPNQVCANIAFLLRFAPDSMMNGELGYAVTTFAVALQALLLRGCDDAAAAMECGWVVFRRGRRRITEAEGRRLLADFMEDCVVVAEPAATCDGTGTTPAGAPSEAERAAAAAAAAPMTSGDIGDDGTDDICKEWVLM